MDGEIYNLHNAKLPEYRDHNTISHEILNEEKFHYSTIHKIDKNIDIGIICAEDKILIQGKNFDIHRKILNRGRYYGKKGN